jgi:hypothetical protein
MARPWLYNLLNKALSTAYALRCIPICGYCRIAFHNTIIVNLHYEYARVRGIVITHSIADFSLKRMFLIEEDNQGFIWWAAHLAACTALSTCSPCRP